MALPSQFSQPKSRRSHMYRRKRGPRKAVIVVLLSLLGVTVAVWAMRGKDSPTEAGATGIALEPQPTDTPAALPRTTLAEAAPRTAQREAARQPEPVRQPEAVPPPRETQPVVRMGESSHQPTEPRTVTAPGSTQPSTAPATTPSAPASAPQREAAAPQPRETQQPAPPPRETQQPLATNIPQADRDRALQRMRAGMEMMNANRAVEARRVLTQALDTNALTRAEARTVRDALAKINDRLVFSPEVVDGDPFTYGYAIRPGDTLGRITSRENLNVDWRFIQRLNRIPRPEQIRAGQNLKLIKGPFHAVVHKREFRMDVYLGEGSDRVFVRSLPVGLGEYDSTPIGTFRVRQNSKLINPEWINPRTRERFASGDPDNPVGTRWIGLEGVSEAVRDLQGYGIHGTIEPESIGQMASMGCVRLLREDVELLYEMLVERESVVVIQE